MPLLALLVLVACERPPAAFPEVGTWTGPGVVLNGNGTVLVPWLPETELEYRASLTWPDGKARDYVFNYQVPIPGDNIDIWEEDDSIVALYHPGEAGLPQVLQICETESCGIQNEDYRSYELGWMHFAYGGAPATGVLLHPDAPVLAVGERRPFQGYAYAPDPNSLISDAASVGLEPPTYEIADPTIATVSDQGVIEGLSVGSTTLTVTAGQATASTEVLVTDAPLDASPRGVFDIGPHTLATGFARGPSQVSSDPRGAPAALINVATRDWSEPRVQMTRFLFAKWTGTGFGYEWMSSDLSDIVISPSLFVDATGGDWVSTRRAALGGLKLVTMHRTGPEQAWTEASLPIRPDLDTGSMVSAGILTDPAVHGAILNIGMAPSADGVWVAYQLIYTIENPSETLMAAWNLPFDIQECKRIVRLAHVGVDGTVDAQTIKTTDIEIGGCRGTGADTDDWMDIDDPVFVSEELTNGLPTVTVVQDGVSVDFSSDGTSWGEQEHVDQPLAYDAAPQVGTDPYATGIVVNQGGTGSGVAIASWRDDLYVGLASTFPDHPLPNRTHIIVADAIYQRHDSPDAEGRRLGPDLFTPQFNHEALVTDTCRLAIDQQHQNGGMDNLSQPMIAGGPDTAWTALPGYPFGQVRFESERFAAAPDGIYQLGGSTDLTLSRATNCEDFFTLATVPGFNGDERHLLLRDDGSVWVLVADDAPGGTVVRWTDPLANPISNRTSSSLTGQDGVAIVNAAVIDVGNAVFTFVLRDNWLAITEYDSDGVQQSATWAELETSPSWTYQMHTAHRLPSGEWLFARQVNASNLPTEIVRTFDFGDTTVVSEIDCAGFNRWESLNDRRCASLVLSDGRTVFAHAMDSDQPNRIGAFLRVFDLNGDNPVDIEVRPRGGSRQGVMAMHEEADGTLSVFLWDNNTYVPPIPGQGYRYDTLVQTVVLP